MNSSGVRPPSHLFVAPLSPSPGGRSRTYLRPKNRRPGLSICVPLRRPRLARDQPTSSHVSDPLGAETVSDFEEGEAAALRRRYGSITDRAVALVGLRSARGPIGESNGESSGSSCNPIESAMRCAASLEALAGAPSVFLSDGSGREVRHGRSRRRISALTGGTVTAVMGSAPGSWYLPPKANR